MKLNIIGFAASIILATTGGALAEAPDLAGQWTGSGFAEVTNGNKERVRCRVTYSKESAKVYAVNAVCASPSIKIYQSGVVSRATINTYLGRVHNNQFDISARVRVVVRGARQTITIKADQGSGQIKLRKL